MPLQNRVDPFGTIHAVPERGLFTGNRGIIHDPATRTLTSRRWTSRAWIVCTLDYRSRSRVPMSRRSWTELFFLDEVTALAAGHRPCFLCRREAARAYAAAASTGGRANDMDRALHAERLVVGAPGRPLPVSAIRGLPDGAMIAIDGRPFAIRAGRLLGWSFSGYGPPADISEIAADATAELLTPPTSVAALRRGYRPVWHPSSAASLQDAAAS